MGCAAGMIKYLVFIFNLVFFLTGIAFLTVGIIYALDFADAVDLPDEAGNFKTAPIAISVIGGFIVVVSFLGCCGAIKGNSCMLITYSCILIVILLIQVAMGIFALLEVDDEEDLSRIVVEQIDKLFKKYDNNDGAKETIHTMQRALECCGRENQEDWFKDPLPYSCCEKSEPCTKGSTDLFGTGCNAALFKFLRDNLQIIGIVLLSLGATELIASVFAICLSRSIKNEGRSRHY